MSAQRSLRFCNFRIKIVGMSLDLKNLRNVHMFVLAFSNVAIFMEIHGTFSCKDMVKSSK